MALLFIDGFDHYAFADMAKKWDSFSIANGMDIAASSGRRGGGAFLVNTYGRYALKSIANTTSFVMGVAVKLAVYPDGNMGILALWDGTTIQCELNIRTDGKVSVTRAQNALTDGVSTSVLALNAWNYIEWKVTIANAISAGSCKVRVNGADWLTVAAGQDLQNTANAYADKFSLGSYSTGSFSNTYFDDFYACDQLGSVNNDFLGDVRIDTLYPTSDGNYTQLTPSTGTSHYALVDEASVNTTDYNSSSTAGNKDTYGMGNLSSTPTSIFGAQICVAALKSDSGARGVKPLLRSGATDSLGAELPLSVSQLIARQIYETDPNTSAAWTESGINAAEAGAQIT